MLDICVYMYGYLQRNFDCVCVVVGVSVLCGLCGSPCFWLSKMFPHTHADTLTLCALANIYLRHAHLIFSAIALAQLRACARSKTKYSYKVDCLYICCIHMHVCVCVFLYQFLNLPQPVSISTGIICCCAACRCCCCGSLITTVRFCPSLIPFLICVYVYMCACVFDCDIETN